MNSEPKLDLQFNPQTEAKRKPTTKEPWNKGKLMGQKPPLKLKEVWEIRIRLHGYGNSPCSTWPSTANLGAVIW